MTSWAVAVLVAICALLSVLLHRSHRRLGLVERRIQDAAAQLESLQAAFERFAPREVVERIIQEGVSIAAEKRDITILFADLKDFTPMSESMDPAVLVRILNGYFRVMSRAITANNGHVSKFIGDGILALFGAPHPNPWQADDAVRAALAMRAALADYNQTLEAQGLPSLRLGVGIHRGNAVSGVIGSDQLMEYTALGATVNLASRVENLTRRHGVDVLITPAVLETIDPRFAVREMPLAQVKGVGAPVATYALIGADSADA